jgi:1-acyl-sn-glycerol-3-phosphate acyltransferase
VVPAAISGSHRILRKGSLRITPGTITIRLGRPIEPPPAAGKDAELQLRDLVRSAIEEIIA